jgi:hypothetical protein
MSKIVESTKLDPSLNFRTLQSTRSFPQYRKVYVANGGTRTLYLTANGASQNVIFNIPAECINLGESYLEYVIRSPRQGGGYYAWMYKDVHGEFDSIMYRDTGSMALVDIKNLHLYNQITNRLNFSDEDLEYNDNLCGLVPTNAPLTDIKCIRFDGTSCSLAYKEPQQMALISGADAQSDALPKKVYLKDLVRDSWFGLAKNQIMPIETYLEINFSNNRGRIGFRSTSAVNPSTGAAELVDFAGGANDKEKYLYIDELCLNLCVEQNQALVSMLKAEVAKGFNVPIPWVRVHQLASTAGENFVYNLPLDNKQHGQRIKRIIYAPLSSSNTANLLYDHRNTNGSKIEQYQTELDNQKQQRDVVYVSGTRNDDYMYHKRLLKNTLYYNQPIYNQNWIHCDSFDYGEIHDKSGGGHIMVDGLLLDKPMTWTFNSIKNTNASYLNTAIVVGMKSLQVNASSFVVV